MTTFQKVSLFLLRVALGAFFLYAGLSKLLNPEWTAEGYLKTAKTFSGFYAWLASPDVISVTNFLNEWGLTLIGVSLILGLFVRLSSFFAIVIMGLYYFPILDFPYVGSHSYLVDEHVIYISALLVLMASAAGRVWGLDSWCAKLPLCKKSKTLRKLFG